MNDDAPTPSRVGWLAIVLALALVGMSAYVAFEWFQSMQAQMTDSSDP